MIIHCLSKKKNLEKETFEETVKVQDKTEDFDLEKLGRCAKASHPLCDALKKRRNGSSLTDARATVKGEKAVA